MNKVLGIGDQRPKYKNIFQTKKKKGTRDSYQPAEEWLISKSVQSYTLIEKTRHMVEMTLGDHSNNFDTFQSLHKLWFEIDS